MRRWLSLVVLALTVGVLPATQAGSGDVVRTVSAPASDRSDRQGPARPVTLLSAPRTDGTPQHSFLEPEHEEQHVLDGHAHMIAPKRKGEPWVHVDLVDPREGAVGPLHRMSAAEMSAASGLADEPVTVQNGGAQNGGAQTAAATPPGSSNVPGLSTHVPSDCSGTDTGNAGNRVQVVYAYEQGATDRYATALPAIRNVVAAIDDVFAVSSRQTGGGRRVRWVQDDSCSPQVLDVALPAGSLGADPNATFTAMSNAGYDAPDRKYLVFADYSTMLYDGAAAGVGQLFIDDRATGNANDGGGALVARVDYWSVSVAGHELMHTLGSVQATSPHHTDNGHCTDGTEMMCYSDGSSQTYSSTVCDAANWADYDCNHDDYFSTSPTAGSYLASHWNTANSSFLASAPVLAPGPTVSLAASTTSLQSGDTVTLTAASPGPVTYSWTTNTNGCTATTSDPDQASIDLTCSAMGSVTLTVQVKALAADGQYAVTSQDIALSDSPAPTASFTMPDQAYPDQPFTVTASATGKGITYAWSVQGGACALTGGQGTPTVTISCPEAAANTYVYPMLEVTQSDGQTAWATMTNQAPTLVLPTPAPDPSPTPAQFATSTTIKATGTYPTTFTGTLKDANGAVLGGKPVSLTVRWYGASSWAKVGSVTTDSLGRMVARYKMGTRAGTFGFRFLGDAAYAGSQKTVFVKVPTRVATTVRTGRPDVVKAVATTASGRALRRVRVVLQRRYAGSARWVKVAGVTTNRYGVATAKQSPGRRTYYRWVLPVTSTRARAISNRVSVRR